MNKFNETYNKIVTEIRYRDMAIKRWNGSLPSIEAGIIYEDVAFHKNDLIQILQNKIDHLNNFINNDNLYIDEVEFYLDIL